MKPARYKYERYDDRSFPVYLSVQKGRETLVEPCFHEEIEFIKVLSGTIAMELGAQKYICGENDIIFLPPFTMHSAQALSEDACLRGIVFHTNILQQPICHTLRCGDCCFFAPTHPNYAQLDHALEQTAQSYTQRGQTYKLEITAHLLLAVCVLIRCGVMADGEENWAGQRIQPALDYIAAHYESPIRLCELSRVLCVCEDHLIRLFRRATGKTPTEYITDFKIAQALDLLCDDQYSISQISERLSFANPSYFSRVFREKLNTTPSQYRTQYRRRNRHG